MQSFYTTLHYIIKRTKFATLNDTVMKKLSMLLVITLMMSGLSVLTGCSSNDDDMSPTDRWPGLTLTRDPEKQKAKTVISPSTIR